MSYLQQLNSIKDGINSQQSTYQSKQDMIEQGATELLQSKIKDYGAMMEAVGGLGFGIVSAGKATKALIKKWRGKKEKPKEDEEDDEADEAGEPEALAEDAPEALAEDTPGIVEEATEAGTGDMTFQNPMFEPDEGGIEEIDMSDIMPEIETTDTFADVSDLPASVEMTDMGGDLTTDAVTEGLTGAVDTVGDVAGTLAGATAGEAVAGEVAGEAVTGAVAGAVASAIGGMGIADAVLSAIPVVGEIALIATAIGGFFLELFDKGKHHANVPPPTEIISSVGSDPSSLISKQPLTIL